MKALDSQKIKICVITQIKFSLLESNPKKKLSENDSKKLHFVGACKPPLVLSPNLKRGKSWMVKKSLSL